MVVCWPSAQTCSLLRSSLTENRPCSEWLGIGCLDSPYLVLGDHFASGKLECSASSGHETPRLEM
jgi:hypothetical protein